ncbi:hypothetical protein HYZ98_00545 [Candidatus Peregrinibacteria bacterium]|nr:hypothetical protein [Candidatus Peregrinibacteria bacterium]
MISPSSPLKSPLSFEQKARAKGALAHELHWVQEPRRPFMILPQEVREETGETLLREMLPGLLALDIALLIRGRGSANIGALLTTLHQKYPEHIAIIPDTEESLIQMVRGGDIALFCTDPTGSKELSLCLEQGTIPIAPDHVGSLLHSYDPVQESGNAFLFQKINPWHAFAAIVRACETFKLPFDWRTIQRHCMETHF